MELDETWIRSHLPPECRDEPIDVFSCEYLDGLTVMQEGERGGPATVVYAAKDEEDLRWWQLEQVCRFAGKTDRSGVWRWVRDHAENGSPALRPSCGICITASPRSAGRRRCGSAWP